MHLTCCEKPQNYYIHMLGRSRESSPLPSNLPVASDWSQVSFREKYWVNVDLKFIKYNNEIFFFCLLCVIYQLWQSTIFLKSIITRKNLLRRKKPLRSLNWDLLRPTLLSLLSIPNFLKKSIEQNGYWLLSNICIFERSGFRRNLKLSSKGKVALFMLNCAFYVNIWN